VYVCNVQQVKEDPARLLEKSSFSSDLAIYSQLDEIAGTNGTASYPREVLIDFLRSKGWVTEEIAAVAENQPEPSSSEPEPSSLLPSLPGPTKDARHIFVIVKSDKADIPTLNGKL